jgi:hypothetical protein
MLLSFGYIEGLFNGQYILLANRGDLNFIFIFSLGEVAFIKMLRQISIIFRFSSWGGGTFFYLGALGDCLSQLYG